MEKDSNERDTVKLARQWASWENEGAQWLCPLGGAAVVVAGANPHPVREAPLVRRDSACKKCYSRRTGSKNIFHKNSTTYYPFNNLQNLDDLQVSCYTTKMNSAYEPELFHLPFPADFEDEVDVSLLSRASSLCATSEDIFQRAAATGQSIPISEDDKLRARAIFDGTIALPTTPRTAVSLHLTALLNEYDLVVVQSAQQIRNLCTNLLLEKAVSGKSEQIQLRAVEMLGKIKDVALFEERTTVMVDNLSTEEIKQKLLQTISKLYQSQITPATITDIPIVDTQLD